MSVQVQEQIASRAVSKSGGKLTARRSFHVWNTAVAIDTPGQVVVLFGTSGLPVYGEAFPESPNLLARDYRIARADGHTDLWVVEWDYGIGDQVGLIGREPGEIGYTEITARIGGGFVDAWRALTGAQLSALTAVGAAYPSGSGNSSRSDIGGTPIDVAGEPLQDVVRQVEIQITEIQGGMPDLSFYLPFVWCRNNTSFLGARIGQLLYTGANVSRIDVNRFQWEHTFVLDRWWHMRQQPYKYADGRIPMMGQPGRQNAESVFFVQPFPTYANFFAMSSNFRIAGSSQPLINVPILGFP